MLKNRTKIEAVAVGLLLILITFGSVFATYRTITSSSDNASVFIRTSNGGMYNATAANLQTALTSLSTTNGGTVWVPPCNLSVSTSLSLVNNTHLIGAGKNSILFKADDANVVIISIHGQSNCTIEKIMFNCNNIDQSAYTGAIDFTQASWSRNDTIKDCYFYRSNKSFIDCQERTAYITIENNYFDNISTSANYPGAIWLSGSYCTIKNNVIKDTYANGIVVESSTPTFVPSYGHIIDGNIIYGRISVGINMETAKAENCTITNNKIFKLNSSAYAGVPYSTGIAAYTGSTVSGNELHNMQDGISPYGANVISGNIIKNVQRYGLNLYSTFGANAGLSKNIVSNNIISIAKMGIYISQGNFLISGNYINATTSHGIADYNSAVYASCVITGNTVRFFGGYGIFGSTYDEITDNVVTNATAGGSGIYKGKLIADNYIFNCQEGIKQTLSDSVIIGNAIASCQAQGIYASSLNNIVVSGNDINQVVGDGIYFSSVGNATVSDNVVFDSSTANDGIEGANMQNSTFTGNVIKGFTDGIHISSGNNIIIVANIAKGCTNGFHNNSGALTYIYHNIGTIV